MNDRLSENNNELNNKCPGCGRHCDLNEPSCPRGEAFARGERPEEGGRGMEHGGDHEWREHRGGNSERFRHDRHGHAEENKYARPDERGFRGGKGSPKGDHRKLEAGEYKTLDTDGKLSVTLHEIHHLSRFGMESRGGQGRILKILAEEGNMTQRALTEKLGVQPGSASEVIGKLERAGFITRSENAEDRRTADVCLTEAGREQLEASKQEKPELFSTLSGEEKEQLLTLLEKLCADWRERYTKAHHNR